MCSIKHHKDFKFNLKNWYLLTTDLFLVCAVSVRSLMKNEKNEEGASGVLWNMKQIKVYPTKASIKIVVLPHQCAFIQSQTTKSTNPLSLSLTLISLIHTHSHSHAHTPTGLSEKSNKTYSSSQNGEWCSQNGWLRHTIHINTLFQVLIFLLYQLLHHALRASPFVGNVGFSWNAASCHNGWLVPSKVLSFFSFASISSTLLPYYDTGYTNCCIDFWNMSFTHHG